MFKIDKLYKDASEYVCDNEDSNVIRTYEQNYMAIEFVRDNYYYNLNKDYEYYMSLINLY